MLSHECVLLLKRIQVKVTQTFGLVFNCRGQNKFHKSLTDTQWTSSYLNVKFRHARVRLCAGGAVSIHSSTSVHVKNNHSFLSAGKNAGPHPMYQKRKQRHYTWISLILMTNLTQAFIIIMNQITFWGSTAATITWTSEADQGGLLNYIFIYQGFCCCCLFYFYFVNLVQRDPRTKKPHRWFWVKSGASWTRSIRRWIRGTHWFAELNQRWNCAAAVDAQVKRIGWRNVELHGGGVLRVRRDRWDTKRGERDVQVKRGPPGWWRRMKSWTWWRRPHHRQMGFFRSTLLWSCSSWTGGGGMVW